MDLFNTKIFYKLNSFSHKFLTSSLEPKKKTKRLTIINPYFLQNILYTHTLGNEESLLYCSSISLGFDTSTSHCI